MAASAPGPAAPASAPEPKVPISSARSALADVLRGVRTLVRAMGRCSRRWREAEEEEDELPAKPFWVKDDAPDQPAPTEDVPTKASAARSRPQAELSHGFELAASLKDDGNVLFAGGQVGEAVEIWFRALEALPRPSEEGGKQRPALTLESDDESGDDASRSSTAPAAKQAAAATAQGKKAEEVQEETRVVELRATLFSNLALGHMKQQKWRKALRFCEEALHDQPEHQKALYRKAECSAELSEWTEAMQALQKLEGLGEDARRLAAGKRDAWKKRAKAEEERQKKMWSAALAKSSKEAQKEETADPAPASNGAGAKNGSSKPETVPLWSPPKIAPSSVFDLRHKTVSWDEKMDFDDKVWKGGLGHTAAAPYYRAALPLSLVAGFALADLDTDESFLTVHVILDGNSAPFAEPHSWGIVLERLKHVKGLLIVYIDIGHVDKKKDAQMPYGMLTAPHEEAMVSGRSAHSSRFLGSYKEFQDHACDRPRVATPTVVLWADASLYGQRETDLERRTQALSLAAASRAPMVILQESELPEHGSPAGGPWLSDQARQSLAILDLGYGAKAISGWHWNRFVIPLDQTDKGILAAHAVLGVIRPPAARARKATAAGVREALAAANIEAGPVPRTKGLGPPSPEEAKALEAQWVAFAEHLRRTGRPVGRNVPEEEKQRQKAEFREFCRLSGRPP